MGKNSGQPHQITKKAVRALTGAGNNSHSSKHLKNLKLLSIQDIYNSKLLCLYKQYTDKRLPELITDMFKAQDLTKKVPKAPRTKTYENTIRFELPAYLLTADNSLLDLAQTLKYSSFKMNMKKHILERYSSLCTQTGCRACFYTHSNAN